MWPKRQMLASNLQILTRLSHPPETKRLIGCCRAPWSKRALGAVEGAQLTALQPIWKQPITDAVTLHQSQRLVHCSVALSLSTAYHKHHHTVHHTSHHSNNFSMQIRLTSFKLYISELCWSLCSFGICWCCWGEGVIVLSWTTKNHCTKCK